MHLQISLVVDLVVQQILHSKANSCERAKSSTILAVLASKSWTDIRENDKGRIIQSVYFIVQKSNCKVNVVPFIPSILEKEALLGITECALKLQG